MNVKGAKVTKLDYLGQDSTDQAVFRGWTEKRPTLLRMKYNPNHFFVLQSELKAIQHTMEGSFNAEFITGDYVYVHGMKPAVMVSFDNPHDHKEAKDWMTRDAFTAIETIEQERRLRIDFGLQVPDLDGLPLACVDAEVDARAGFPRHETPTQRILGIAIIGSDGYEDFITHEDESLIFKEAAAKLGKYRVITGWNIDGFDKPYLRARAKLIRAGTVSPEDWVVPGASWVDAIKIYKSTEFARGKSARLDDTAKRELNREIKKEFESLNKMHAMWDSFVSRDGKLGRYCLEDARACFDIVRSPKLQLLERYLFPIANIASTDFEDTMLPSRVVEAVVLKEGLESTPRLVFPCEHSFNKDAESFEGGRCIDPATGLWTWVVTFDFQSLYNRAMQTWNIGLDSFIYPEDRQIDGDYIRTPDGKLYSKTPSVYRRVLKRLEVARNFYRNLSSTDPAMDKLFYILQNAYKIVVLEVWGVLGLSSSRLFDRAIAESIAACGRWSLTCAEDYFKSINCNVTYGDTDSIFVRFPNIDDPHKLLNTFIPVAIDGANAYIKQKALKEFNIPPEFYCLNLEYRELYDKYYIPTKKRYIGRIVDKGYPCFEIFTRGFEIAKFSAFDLYKKTQKDIFNIIFRSDTLEDIVRGSKRYMDDVRDGIFSGKLDEQLVLRSGVHALPEAYTVDQPYVTAAKKLATAGLFRVGDIVKYVITADGKDGLDAEPIISEIPKISRSGYQYYWSRLKEFHDNIMEYEGGIANIKLDKFCEVSS